MTGVYNLNNGVKISELYKDLDKEQIETIEKASKGGFTAAELKSLEEDGIDTSLIKKNSTKETDTKNATKTTTDVNDKVEELKEKYLKTAYSSGDPYKSSNPELKALNELLDDGVVLTLGKEGYSKTQIVDIISQIFPSLGISSKGDNGEYTRPIGHDEEAQKIFSRFSSHLVTATGTDSPEIKAAREKLASINNQILSNNQEMQVLEVTIEALQDEVEEQIKEAIDESEDIQDENKKKAKEAINTNLNDYTNSKGEMTYEQFKSNVSSDLKGIKTKSGRELSEVMCSLMDANYKMNLLKGYVSDLNELNMDNVELSADAEDAKIELDNLIEEAANSGNSDPDAECTDPIGFYNNTTRYDFFVDKDKNEDITNEKEFLGAEKGFEEVHALDTDDNGIVTASELEKANVKVIKTGTDGIQKILDPSEIFKNSNDGIKLDSYEQTNQDIGDGNKLIGTFSATVEGQNLSGYQTLDTNEWLDENYDFTDKDEGIGRFSLDSDEVVEAYNADEKINIFTLKNEELSADLDEAWSAYGFSENMSQSIIDSTNAQASKKGKAIESKFEEIAKKEEEIAQWSEEEMEADKEKWEKENNKEIEDEAKEEDNKNSTKANEEKTETDDIGKPSEEEILDAKRKQHELSFGG